jgi:methionine synthase II (cobalamin-independent)
MSNQSTSVAKLRVDQVGSLLRPQKLKDVYARHGNGEAGDEEIAADSRRVDPRTDRA